MRIPSVATVKHGRGGGEGGRIWSGNRCLAVARVVFLVDDSAELLPRRVELAANKWS